MLAIFIYIFIFIKGNSNKNQTKERLVFRTSSRWGKFRIISKFSNSVVVVVTQLSYWETVLMLWLYLLLYITTTCYITTRIFCEFLTLNNFFKCF